jgi:hypothetical protein
MHADAVKRLKELGAEVKDLTPLGLDGTSYHLVTATADQATALSKLGIKLEDVTPRVIADLPPRDSSGFLYCRGGKIPNGTKLRIQYKSRTMEAEVRGGYIWIEGNRYDSPSDAARAVGYGSVNGWNVWEYYDEPDRKWYALDQLRVKFARAAAGANTV